MLKYVNTDIVFQEIPDETTLAMTRRRWPLTSHGVRATVRDATAAIWPRTSATRSPPMPSIS